MKTLIILAGVCFLVFVFILFLIQRFKENKTKVWNLDPPKNIGRYPQQEHLRVYILHYFKRYPVPTEILADRKKALKYIRERIDPLAENLSSKLQRNSWPAVSPQEILEEVTL